MSSVVGPDLFDGAVDRQANRWHLRVASATVRRFHETWSPAGDDPKAFAAKCACNAPARLFRLEPTTAVDLRVARLAIPAGESAMHSGIMGATEAHSL